MKKRNRLLFLAIKYYRKINVQKVTALGAVLFLYPDIVLTAKGDAFGQEKINEISYQAEHSVTGVVYDEDGKAIMGASIIDLGTGNSISTDEDGKFSMKVKQKTILKISFTGFISQEIEVEKQKEFTITLLRDLQTLDEVVVVGYGTQKKATLTGAVVTVKGTDLVKSPAANVTQSLAGRLPGVVINSRSGEPGRDDPSIMIRGRGTTGATNPLVIIDGVERGGLGQINPNDIETISVLKDASAAIYGSRAANGVILVTTKRGVNGKPSINLSFNQGFSQPTRNPKMADSYTFAKISNNIERDEGREPIYSDLELQKYKDGSDPNYPSTDWYSSLVRTAAPQHRGNISVAGGSDRSKYYFSLGELSQSGQYKEGSTKFGSYNLRSNVDVEVTNNLTVGLNMSGRVDNRHYPFRSNNELNSHIYLYQPNWQAYWPGTDYMQPLRGSENAHNWVTDNAGFHQEDTRTAQSTLSFKWDVPWVNGLSVDGSGSYDFGGVYTKRFETPSYVYQIDGKTGEYSKQLSGMSPSLARLNQTNYAVTQSYFTSKINYAKQFNLHHVGIMVGYEQTQIKNSTLEAGRSDFLSISLPEINMGSSDKTKQSNGGFSGQDARQNVFSRVNYNYAEKYLAEITLRADGSSKFPKEKRYGFFPGVSLGWRISEESFMTDLDFIDNLKIRGSYGKMGNDAIAAFQYMMTYGFNNNYVIGNNDVSGLVQTNVPNPFITWETARTWNIGFDAGFWNGLLDIEFDYFKSRRSDILTKRNATVPDYTGLKLPDENIGIVDNKGFELVLSHRNTVNALTYRLSGNVSFARNKVVFADEQPAAEPYQYATGRPYGAALLYKSIGVFRDQAQVDATPNLPGTKPGDLIYEDVNNDGTINSLDRIRVDQTNIPEVTFGFNASVAYKGLELSVLFQGQENVKQYFGGWFPVMSHTFGNFLDWRANDSWSPDHVDATMPRGSTALWTTSTNSSYASTHWLKDAGFLRLKNIELGYNLPLNICKSLGLKALRVNVSGSNLFMIYDNMKKMGFDPETQDFWYYPQQRVLNFGMNLTF
ncbi:SusC/RagA family TonB-linked outer membrane protein [Sphingobacterium faecium]|uniref:SusC/RagA family TonB-linked outer membrane protein n=1 Tax=Sphingobacterium faecium TaxID=34087 RepID=UPI00246928ED|nr:TonB-dependent receptor [Sphingobacterium faecium]MDH5827437.1 TonB-dependent receptor [Sphingobacterium faecium]